MKQNLFMLKWLALFIFCNILFSTLSAQDSVAVRYSKLIDKEDLKKHLSVLSSDSLEGRETGKSGQKKAAADLSEYFFSNGLKPISHETFMQDFPISLRANQGKNIEVNQQYFLFMKDYYYSNGYADTLIVLDTIVFVGYGTEEKNYNDFAKINVNRKAILFFDGELQNKKYLSEGITRSTDRKKKLCAICEKKPSVVFIVCDSLDKIIDSLNYIRHVEDEGGLSKSPTTIPVIFITHQMARNFFPEAEEEILDEAKSKIDRKGKPQSFISKTSAFVNLVSNTNQLKGQNVVGFLEGTDKKNETIVITAHYDHLGKNDSTIYYGADDNGSGTSSVMELAKIFSQAKKEGHAPRRSMLFMTVSGEEKGLLGSSYYVNHPLVPLEKTVADINIDMIGRTDEKHDSIGVSDYIYIIGSDKLSTELHQINETENTAHTKLELDYSYNKSDDPNRYYYRSDHYNFAKNNIPIIFYFNGTHKDYHKPTDTIDKIDFDLLAKRTQLIFFTAWELANRDKRIRVDKKNDLEKE